MTKPKGTRIQPKQSTLELQVSHDLTVQVIESREHEFLMTTKQVAKGYGVPPSTVAWHISGNPEIKWGKHFIKGIDLLKTLSKGVGLTNTLTKNLQPNQIYWTKAGVVRLGFHLKGERAKNFRDWAEKLVLQKLEAPKPLHSLPPARKGKHNRLTQERIIGILSDVCLIYVGNIWGDRQA